MLPQLNVFKKKIVGDIFGSANVVRPSMLGLMYKSRTHSSSNNPEDNRGTMDRLEEIDFEDDDTNYSEDVTELSGSDEEITEKLNPKQQLAVTIKNWTTLPENDEHVMEEGGVSALIALASFDDAKIRKCVALALLNLSMRGANRHALISAGSASGIVVIGMNAKSKTLSRVCALVLYNLSMAKGGEVTITKAGAVIALSVLMGLNRHRLMPICVSALYNLTCVDSHFQNMDRIMKALLSLPVYAMFDSLPYQLKAIVNCSRFSWLRSRILEDGVLNTLTAVINSLSTRERNSDLVLHTAVSLRALSETKSCLPDMISKGAMELLQQLLPYCNEDSYVLVAKTLRNLLKIVQTFPVSIFGIAVNIATEIATQSIDITTLQYVSSCFHIFSYDDFREDARLCTRVIKILFKLFSSTDNLTQYFSVATAVNIFFSNMCEDGKQLEQLVLKLVEAGPKFTDLAAMQEFIVGIAKLSQESVYLGVLHQNKKLGIIMQLLLRIINSYSSNYLIQENSCVAVCLIALKMEQTELVSLIDDIASLFYKMISDDYANSGDIPDTVVDVADNDPDHWRYVPVLTAAVSGIRALIESGLCHSEFLSKPQLISKLANIMARFSHKFPLIARYSCACLTHYSFDSSTHLDIATKGVMKILFGLTKSDDISVLEAIAVILCNISTTLEARTFLIEFGVLDVLAILSGETNELLQEMCAKCMCNLTSTVEHQSLLIKNGILSTLLMISLVRSVSHITKMLSAMALFNLLSSKNMDALISAGVIQGFAKLSTVKDSRTQAISAKAFLLFSSHESGRREMSRLSFVLSAVFGLLKTGKQNKLMILAGRAVCNLLSCPISRGLVVKSGGLSMLEIMATMNNSEFREITASVLFNLVEEEDLHPLLLREPLVSILVYVMEESSEFAFQCAVRAFASLAQQKIFRVALIEQGCVENLVGTVIKGLVHSVDVAREICRCFCHLSYEESKADYIISTGHVLVALYCMYKGNLCDFQCAHMIAIILRNLSYGEGSAKMILDQEGLKLMEWILDEFHEQCPFLFRCAVVFMHNMCKAEELRVQILSNGIMSIAYKICFYSGDMGELDDDCDSNASSSSGWRDGLNMYDVFHLASAFRLLSETSSCRFSMVTNKCVVILGSLLGQMCEVSRHELACVLKNLSSAKECRRILVKERANDLVTELSRDALIYETQQQCSAALSYLSEFAIVSVGEMSSLLALSLKLDAKKGDLGQGQDGRKNRKTSIRRNSTAAGITLPNTISVNPVNGRSSFRKAMDVARERAETAMARASMGGRRSDGGLFALIPVTKSAPEGNMVNRKLAEFCEEVKYLSEIPDFVKYQELSMLIYNDNAGEDVDPDKIVPTNCDIHKPFSFSIRPYSVDVEAGGLARQCIANRFPLPQCLSRVAEPKENGFVTPGNTNHSHGMLSAGHHVSIFCPRQKDLYEVPLDMSPLAKEEEVKDIIWYEEEELKTSMSVKGEDSVKSPSDNLSPSSKLRKFTKTVQDNLIRPSSLMKNSNLESPRFAQVVKSMQSGRPRAMSHGSENEEGSRNRTRSFDSASTPRAEEAKAKVVESFKFTKKLSNLV